MEMNRMRIAVVGDIQYRKGEDITEIAQDISALEPDTVIIVGDYGYWDGFGSYEVFREIENAFRQVKCRQFIPLLGNHDVQFEAGEVYMKKGTVAANYQQAFGQAPEKQAAGFRKLSDSLHSHGTAAQRGFLLSV